jgi:hypothetical protein
MESSAGKNHFRRFFYLYAGLKYYFGDVFGEKLKDKN